MNTSVHLIHYKLIQQMQEVHEVPKGVQMIQAPRMWERTRGEGVTVAVLDTGCDASHRDLKDRITGGKNFTNDDDGDSNIFKDYNGHGTHVAGTIAGSENGQGVIGVAPQANLLILKVLGEDGAGQYQWIIDAIHYAIKQKVDIISMSLGGPEDIPALHEAIRSAVLDHHISVVCAAGNEGDGDHATNEFAYPGSYNEVISVGAVDLQRESSDFSNSNNQVDLVAPGEEITSTYLNDTYATLSGTSMAAPHVSGALVLIKNLTIETFGRPITEPELYAQLIKRTIPLEFSPNFIGNGLIYVTLLDHMQNIYDDLISATQKAFMK